MISEDNLQYKIWHPEEEGSIAGILDAASMSHQQDENSTEWFKWKFSKSPFGHSIISYAKTSDGTIAGAVAFGMYELSFHKKNIKAALSYETFVHPAHQGRGLFTKLTKAAMEEAKKRGVDILFNFPNTKSLPGFKKLGWKEQSGIKLWTRPSSYFKFLLKLNLNTLKKSFIPDKSVAEKMLDPLAFDNLKYHKILNEHPNNFIAYRTKEYLKWRFATFPLNNYRVVEVKEGACIIRTGHRGNYSEIQIMEFFPKETFNRNFLNALFKEIKNGISPDLITINISQSHPANRLLKLKLFFSLPNKINFTVYPLNKEKIGEIETDWIITGTEFHTY